MAKVKIKLFGTWEAWSDAVRWGQLIRPDGSVTSVLLRTTGSPRIPAEDSHLLASLHHPNILQLFHATAIAGSTALVYERFEGVAMSRVLPELTRRSRHMPVRAALEVCAQVCAALQHARDHSEVDRSIIHPGPCPAEILIDESGHVRLAGLMVLSADGEIDTAPPGYVPPEGCGAEGAWAYGIGALVVELLSGERPAVGSSDPSRHEAMIRRALIRVLARSGEPAPEAVINLIRQCMARQPEARPGLSEVTVRIDQLSSNLPSARLRPWASGCVPAILQLLQPDVSAPLPEPTRPIPAGLPRIPPLPVEDLDHEPPTEEAPRRTLPIQPMPSQAQRDALVSSEPVVGFAPGDFSHTEVSGPSFIPPEPEPAVRAPIAAPEPLFAPSSDFGEEPEDSEALYTPRQSSLPLFLGGFLAMAALWVVGVLAWRVVTMEPDTESVDEPVAVASSPETPEPPIEPEPSAEVPEQPPAPEVAAVPAVPSAPPVISKPAPIPQPEPEPIVRAEPLVRPVAVPSEPEPEVARIVPSQVAAEEPPDAPNDEPIADAAALTPESPPVPSPSVFRVEFRSADPGITELQIRCHKGSGSSSGTVVIPDAGRGPCKVIGLKGEERLVTSVSLTGEKVWVCFTAGARSCQ